LLTSRAEYRLLLRQDNADLRLTEMGRKIGLVDDNRWRIFNDKLKKLEEIKKIWYNTVFSVKDTKVQRILKELGSSTLRSSIRAEELLKRPEFTVRHLQELIPEINNYEREILEEAAIQIKYKGYIDKQQEEVEKFIKLEEQELPADLDYDKIRGLSNEAKQRLKDVNPQNVGQASRISGVNPADISVLLIYLEQRKRGMADARSESND